MTKKKKSRGRRDAVRVQSGALRAARLSAIKSDILNNLRQHTLSIHGTASRHGISVRYIRQLFAAAARRSPISCWISGLRPSISR
jgi:hypothetical protein